MFIVNSLPQSYLPSCSQQIPFPACLCPIFGSGYLSSIGFPSAASGKTTSSFGSSLSSVANTSPLSDLAYCWGRRKSFLDRFGSVAGSEYLFSIGYSVLFAMGTLWCYWGISFLDRIFAIANSESLSAIGCPLFVGGNLSSIRLPSSVAVNKFPQSGFRFC